MKQVLTLTLSGILAGCAGPNTPLGAVWAWTPADAMGESRLEEDHARSPAEASPHVPEIHLNPENQILHGPAPLRVTVRDPAGDLDHYRFSVRYNGFDVTRSFLSQCRISQKWSERSIVFENPVLRLPAEGEHLIEFSYRSATGDTARTRYAPPVCYAFRPATVTHTGDFRPSPGILAAIDTIARQEGFNPAFFTGLVAQESRFVPTAVSWAKALGLTQVTSSAEKEVAALYSEWPRYPGVEQMSVEKLRLLVLSGKMNSTNEWRLDPRLSIRGGAAFARMLAERWSTPNNLQRIRTLFADSEVEHAKLILASYHSGYSRVMGSLDRRGKDWLKAPELQEARKYINRIFSYCSYFGKGKARKGEDQDA